MTLVAASLAAAPTSHAQSPQPVAPLPGVVAPQAFPFAAAPPLAAAAAGIRGRIVRRARGQLGYADHGHFCTRFGPCEVWCALFATWVWHGAGIPIGRLPFTGSIYDWAAASTYVLGRDQPPEPGDAVLFGSGPGSVDSSLHVGIVETVYPRYIVTIEGDADHAVRRFVVPLRNPQSIGEPGPIYAYASPLRQPLAGRSIANPRPARLAPALLRQAVANQDVRMKLTPTDIRLRNTIRLLRAFQHMPYQAAGTKIGWYGIDEQGRPQIAVIANGSLASAEFAWQQFLQRSRDTGTAYAVSFYTAQP